LGSKGGPGVPKRIVNWEKVKRDYLFSDDTLNKVANKHKLSNPCIYKHAKAENWPEQKKRFQENVTHEISEEMVDQNVAQWKNQIKLWRVIEYQVAKILNKYHGENKPAIKPTHLINLAFALNVSLKSQKLIYGEPTEHITEESHYKSIIYLMEKKRRERERVIDAEKVGSELGSRGQIRRDIQQQVVEDSEPLQDKG